MNRNEARAIAAASLDCRELAKALHAAGGVADGVRAPLLRMQEHMGPLVDEARRMLAPAEEVDPDEMREAARDARWAQ